MIMNGSPIKVVALHCIMTMLVMLLTSCRKQRMPERHVVPSSYEGVVITIYNQKGFPELPVENGYLLFEYPEDGIIITSSAISYGWASDQTLDALPDGTRHHFNNGHAKDRREHFAASGTHSTGGNVTLEYAFRVVGSQTYYQSIDASAYDAKVAEAEEKLQSLKAKQNP